MTFREIRYDVEDGVCTVTLNRPDRLNAVTTTMLGELGEAWDRADADDAVRAVIVTGAGRAFCAGADLGAGGATFDYRRASAGGDSSDRSPRAWGPQPPGGPAARSAAPRRPAARTADAAARRRSASAEDHRDGGGIVTLRVFDMKKPVIAAINGPAVGFGITLTLPMDIRIASPAARIGFVFVRRGVVPEACSTWFLPRLVGISQAAELGLHRARLQRRGGSGGRAREPRRRPGDAAADRPTARARDRAEHVRGLGDAGPADDVEAPRRRPPGGGTPPRLTGDVLDRTLR